VGKFWGREEVGKKKHVGREDGIFVHPQNGFNGLILNWCIGGCWFTPAQSKHPKNPFQSKQSKRFHPKNQIT
jgi:hypothetical protein